MNRTALAIIAAALAGASASAQTWSLDSCINYAHEHNITVRQRLLDRNLAEYAVTEAKDRFLPTVSAGARQSFDFGRGLTSENTYANRNTQAFGWSVDMNLPIFQGLAGVRRLDYAKVDLRKAIENIDAAKDDITLNIIAQYLQVLYSKEISEVAADQARISELELARRRELLDAGKIAELDVLEAEAQLANDQLTAVNAANDVVIALTDLSQMLQLPYSETFDIRPLEPYTEEVLPAIDEVFAHAVASNHGMLAADLAVRSAESNVRLSRTGYMPTLSFNAGLNSSYYRVSGLDNPGFGRQMRDNFSRGLGFTLSVPLFDAFGTRNNVRRAQAAVTSATLQADDVRTRLYNNISQAHVRAVAARRKCASGKVAEDAARAAFEAMQHKYNYGRATATEFEQAKSAWFKARADLIQSQYEAQLRARILAFYNN